MTDLAAALAQVTHPLDALPLVLGARLTCGSIVATIVEAEAYGTDPSGPWPDPGAHTYGGRSTRNATMFGPPGHCYVYQSYGLHFCLNVVYAPDGVGAGILLRALRVDEGIDLARTRRPAARMDAALARGPGCVGQVLGLSLADDGLDWRTGRVRLTPGTPIAPDRIAYGPRVGLTKAFGYPWRAHLIGEPAVSAYRRSPRANPAEPVPDWVTRRAAD